MEHELLITILNKIENMSTVLTHVEIIVQEHTIILEQHTKILDEHTAIVEYHSKMFGCHEEKLDEHSNDIASIKRTLLLIENAVTNKIPALFAGYQSHQEKRQEFNSRIHHVEDVSEINSIKISILEDTSKAHSKQLNQLLSF